MDLKELPGQTLYNADVDNFSMVEEYSSRPAQTNDCAQHQTKLMIKVNEWMPYQLNIWKLTGPNYPSTRLQTQFMRITKPPTRSTLLL
jgi:hypothetical protein